MQACVCVGYVKAIRLPWTCIMHPRKVRLIKFCFSCQSPFVIIFGGHHRLSFNHEDRWGTTDDFATNFLRFFPVFHCPLGPAELQTCPFPDVVFPPLPLSALSSSPLSLCLARWFWPDLMNGKHDRTTAVCVSLRSSRGLRVVQLPAGSRHGLPRR